MSVLIVLPSFEFALFLGVELAGTCELFLDEVLLVRMALLVRMGIACVVSSDAFLGIMGATGSDGE